MLYQGKPVEVIGTKDVLGSSIAWIRVLDTGEFLQVAISELEESDESYGWPHIRFAAIACKIKEEVARKNILAPYESSLIPLPHQILVLEKVMQSDQNRFLLADEVGMGKTIEAGLILKELKLRGEVSRILVIVPKSAMLQWQSELKEHFNEVFHIYDSQLINALARTFGSFNADRTFNFWEQHDQVIVSTDALKPVQYRAGWSKERIDEYNRYRMEAVLEADFDLVIIDEVHKMGGSTPLVSRYILAQALCNVVPNALLLSATPHRGKSDHFRRILQLLDPDAFDGEGLPELDELQPYVIRTEKRLAVDYEGSKLFNERHTKMLEVSLDPVLHRRQIELYSAVTDYVRKGFSSAMKSKNTAVGLIMILFQRLASSSTAAILSAMQGRLERLRSGEEENVQDIWKQEADGGEYLEIDAFSSPATTFHFSESPDDEISRLVQHVRQAKACLQHELDAKAARLIDKYDELKQQYKDPDLKILVFTEFRATQAMLRRVMEERGYRCEIINGDQGLEERRSVLKRFKNQSQLLIATDAAGESLNMQFCHIVFNYDLPWNPMVLEQRIGRVDRIGQEQEVKAYNLLLDNSVDRRVFEIIETKLTAILEQLGIDKTGDVLDSTIDPKEIESLYLKSLLDPAHFEDAGEQWLESIKQKLREYQSTEGILPEVQEEEIEYKKAADVVHSPLPVWLEDLLVQHAGINKGEFQKFTDGTFQFSANGASIQATLEPEVALNNPGVEHLTLQHDAVKKTLDQLPEYSTKNGIPSIQLKEGKGVSGWWSLWKIEAMNTYEYRVTYHPVFLSDAGRHYRAYANDIWNQLVSNADAFRFAGLTDVLPTKEQEQSVQKALKEVYQDLEGDVHRVLDQKLENKEKSYQYQVSRIEKIGIENIRLSKLKRLEKEFLTWKQDFLANRKVIPDLRLIMQLRING